MSLLSIQSINGKPLKKAQINLLAKLDSLGVKFNPDPAAVSFNHINPCSGVSVTLVPLASCLASFILEAYSQNHGFGPLTYKGKVVPLPVWDRTRHLFLEFWPDEYYKLLD